MVGRREDVSSRVQMLVQMLGGASQLVQGCFVDEAREGKCCDGVQASYYGS